MLTINKKTLTIAISAAIVATGASTVHAAGFQLKEQSAEGQGNSFAGQTAKAVDASTIFFNPAGMARLEGNHVQSNLSYIAPKAKYDHKSTSGALGAFLNDSTDIDGGVSAIVPAAYAVWDYSDDIKFGISINAPYGLSTEYGKDWVGAEYNVLSEIKTINLAPSFSYRVNEKLSIGGNVQFQKVEGTLTTTSTTNTTNTLDADDTGYGYAIGVLYEYSDKGRIGASYRSKIDHTLEGTLTAAAVGGVVDAQAEFSTPASASIGIYQEISPKWTLLADISWTDWSSFEELKVTSSASGAQLSNTAYNWSDNVFVSVGANYQYNDKLQLKFGVAYDEGAANDEDRTAGIPDESRIWTSAGASYKLNKQTTFNAGYSYIKASKADVSESPGGTKASGYSGEFDSSVNILSVGVNYQF